MLCLFVTWHVTFLSHVCAFKVLFCFSSRNMKASWEEGGREPSVLLTSISTKVLLQHSSAFVCSPATPQRQTMEYLCCSVCLIPILYASTKKPFHSDIHARAGINNTRCAPPCFTFTKKIGVSKNQDHVGLCVLFLKCVALSFQTS